MASSSVSFTYTETFASATTCGRKHRMPDNLRLNEDRCGYFTIQLDTDENVHAFYVLDGHGESIPSELVPTYVSPGSRYVELVQSFLPTVLTELLNSALSSPDSDDSDNSNNFTENLQHFHERVDKKAVELDPELCKENGSTALVGFVLRDLLYVLCVGDSCALLMDDGTGAPIKIWGRCGVEEEMGMCSWMDSVDGYPIDMKEGQNFNSVKRDYYGVGKHLIMREDPNGFHYRLYSKNSAYTLSMINSLGKPRISPWSGNMLHKSSMLSRTNVYTFHLPSLFRVLPQTPSHTPSVTLILCTDGAKDELSARDIARFMHDPYKGLSHLSRTPLNTSSKWTAFGASEPPSLDAMVDTLVAKHGVYRVHERGNKGGRKRMIEAVNEAKLCAHQVVGEADWERVTKRLKYGCRAVVAASILLGTPDDVTCLAVRIAGKVEESDDTTTPSPTEAPTEEALIASQASEDEEKNGERSGNEVTKRVHGTREEYQDEEVLQEEGSQEHPYNLLGDGDLEHDERVQQNEEARNWDVENTVWIEDEDDVDEIAIESERDEIIPGYESDINLSTAEDYCIYDTELPDIEDSYLGDALLAEDHNIYDANDDTPHTAIKNVPISNVWNNSPEEKHFLSSDHVLFSPSEIIAGQPALSITCIQPVNFPSPTPLPPSLPPLLPPPSPLLDSTPFLHSYAALNVTASTDSWILNPSHTFTPPSPPFSSPPILDDEESELYYVGSPVRTKQDIERCGEAVEPLPLPSPKDRQLHHAKWPDPPSPSAVYHNVAQQPSLERDRSMLDGDERGEWNSSPVGVDEDMWLDESKGEWPVGTDYCGVQRMKGIKRKLGDED